MTSVILESVVTCPECGYVRAETMPKDACQWFYECEQCHTLLKPKPGDCCVFCSYGSMPCPPCQTHCSTAVAAVDRAGCTTAVMRHS
jgi:hypothetical protein